MIDKIEALKKAGKREQDKYNEMQLKDLVVVLMERKLVVLVMLLQHHSSLLNH